MLTLKNTFEIFRQIAIDSEAHQYLQFNAFGLIQEFADLNESNLGKDHYDSDYGTYWIREGVTLQNNEARYPILAIEVKNGSLELDHLNFTPEVWVSIIQDGENRHGRTKDQVDVDGFGILQSVIREFLSYGYYSYDGSDYWMSPARFDAIKQSGDTRKNTMRYFVSEIGTAFLSKGTAEHQFITTCSLKLNTCQSVTVNFSPQTAAEPASGIVKCEVC